MCMIVVIKIMLSERVKSASKLFFPVSRDQYKQRQEELLEYNRQLLSKQSLRSSKRMASTAPYPHSSNANRFTRSSFAYKRSSEDFEVQHVQQRPFTQSRPKRYLEKSASPLSIIKTHQQMQPQDNNMHRFMSSRQIKTNFLKKGSSIDRAIIANVLKSKANTHTTPSAFSYSDVPANQEIIRLIQRQIPKGVKDVIGPQEMMRMSHIMTGVKFKTLSLTQRLNAIVKEHRAQVPILLEQDDNLTLKSIKRW